MVSNISINVAGLSSDQAISVLGVATYQAELFNTPLSSAASQIGPATWPMLQRVFERAAIPLDELTSLGAALRLFRSQSPPGLSDERFQTIPTAMLKIFVGCALTCAVLDTLKKNGIDSACSLLDQVARVTGQLSYVVSDVNGLCLGIGATKPSYVNNVESAKTGTRALVDVEIAPSATITGRYCATLASAELQYLIVRNLSEDAERGVPIIGTQSRGPSKPLL
jgi:hypothetical protein